jgi:hypothetical protein
MIVEDNGPGFCLIKPMPSGCPSNRLGLPGMRERWTLVPGALELSQVCMLYVGAPL